MPTAFISYTRRPGDVGPVEAIRSIAESFGLDVWLDSRSLVAGDDFQQEIERGIGAADVVILAASAESLSSDYVLFETRRAHATGKAIIPFLLDDIAFERAPEHLRGLHAEPLFRRPRTDWPRILWEVFSKRGLALHGAPPTASSAPVPYARAFRPNYRELRGDSRATQAHIEEALRALKYDSASGWTVLNLALLYLSIGDFQNAASNASRAVTALPHAGEAHYVAALVMAAQEPIKTLPLEVVRQILFRLDAARSHGFGDPIVDVLTVIVCHERFERHALLLPPQAMDSLERLRKQQAMNLGEYIRTRDLLHGLDPILCARLP